MNNLQHIRSMAEMILKQLDELEGKQSPDKFFKEMETWTSGISIPGNVAKPKFKIGDRVIKTTGTSDVLVIKEIHPYPDGTGWNCILNAGCQNEDHLTLYISDEQANEVWFGPKAGERIWHSGPPPHVGWWNASFDFVKGNNDWRWWDGKCWSIVVDRFMLQLFGLKMVVMVL